MKKKLVEDKCSECGCDHKTKYMLRVDHDSSDPKAKSHFESTSRRSVVGWIKHIVDNYEFEDITIHNLRVQCEGHKHGV